MYVGNMNNAYGEVYMNGKILDKLKKRWNKFKKMSPKQKFGRIVGGALLGPLIAPVVGATALATLPVAGAIAPIVGTHKVLKKVAGKNKAMQNVLKIGAMGLIPGVGPIVATATAAKLAIEAKKRADAAAAASAEAAEIAAPGESFTTPEQEQQIEYEESPEGQQEEEEATKKESNKKLLIGAAIAGGAVLLPMIL
jgi:hypothetical protein